MGCHSNLVPLVHADYWMHLLRSMWCCWNTAIGPADSESKDKGKSLLKSSHEKIQRDVFLLICSHLCFEAKGVGSELSDTVVLQENPLRVVGHAGWNSSEVLRLTAHSHGHMVANTQPGTCLARCTATCQQPYHQPKRQTTCGARKR